MLLGLPLHFTTDRLARPAGHKVGHNRRWTNTGFLLAGTTSSRSSAKPTWPGVFSAVRGHPCAALLVSFRADNRQSL